MSKCKRCGERNKHARNQELITFRNYEADAGADFWSIQSASFFVITMNLDFNCKEKICSDDHKMPMPQTMKIPDAKRCCEQGMAKARDNPSMESKKEGILEGNFWHGTLDQKWWADSMECYLYLRNIQDLVSDGEPFKAPTLHIGALVEEFVTIWWMTSRR